MFTSFLRAIPYTFIFISISFSLFAEEAETSSEPSLFYLVNEPSAFVPVFLNGGVDAINGDYIQHSIDLYLPGPEPLIYERSYSSFHEAESHPYSLFLNGWRCGIQSQLTKEYVPYFKIDKEEHISAYFFQNLNGSRSRFDHHKNKFIYQQKYNTRQTNTSGLISGQTNAKNGRLFEKDEKTFEYYSGSGEKYILTKFGKKIKSFYHISQITKPNGSHIICDYSKKGYQSKIKCLSPNKSILYSEVNIEHFKDWNIDYDKPPKEPTDIIVKGSNGQSVTYRFERVKFKYFLDPKKTDNFYERFQIKDVLHSNGKKESYEYVFHNKAQKPQMSRKILPEGRVLEIEYFESKNNDIGRIDVKNLNVLSNSPQTLNVDNKTFIRNRVRLIKAPLGKNNALIITHRFHYEFHKKPNGDNYKKGNGWWYSGSTHVYDAAYHKTTYQYSCEHRLTSIQKYLGNKKYSPYSVQRFFWEEEETHQEQGQILSQTYEDGQNNILICKNYEYDARGNVIHERIYGNITGTNEHPILLDSKGKPLTYCVADSYGKSYKYSEDGKNLMLLEVDGEKITRYSYKKGTDLLESTFICEGNNIRERQFFEHDKNGVLVKKIIDDGSSKDVNNLANVHCRHISYIQYKMSHPGIGLPLIIEQKYLDLKSHSEQLLSKIINFYSDDLKLIKQEHYDSSNVLQFTLEWDYDQQGNVLMEKNALGHSIYRTYDANGNILTELGPRANQYKVHTYDAANRMIKTEQIIGGGTTLTTTYEYDSLSNKIKVIDASGNATSFVYDDFNRVIKTIQPPIMNEVGCVLHPEVKLEYNVQGYVCAHVDALGNRIEAETNILGKPIKIRNPDGSCECMEYYLNGCLKRSTSKNGTYTEYEYDYLQRPTSVKIYSAQGELLSAISNAYQGSRLVSSTNEEGLVTYYEYDDAGRQKIVRKGDHLTQFEYDSMGRLKETWSLISKNKRLSESNGYKDSWHVKVCEYDLLDNIIEEREQNENGTTFRKTCYAYDESGNKIEVTNFIFKGDIESNSIEASTSFYKFNGLNQIIESIDALGNKTTYQYDNKYPLGANQWGHKIIIIDPMGNITETIQNAVGNGIEIIKKNAFGNILSTRKLNFDANGNRRCVVDKVFSNHQLIKEIETVFEYDCCNRLISLIEAKGTVEQKITKYEFNNFGEREIIIKPDGVILRHTYDEFGRLLSLKSSEGSISYTYHYHINGKPESIVNNVNGNLFTTKLEYDQYQNLTREVLENGVSIKYEYDGLGRAIKIILPEHDEIHYEYDCVNLSKVTRLNSSYEVIYSHKYKDFDLSGHLLCSQLIGQAGEVQYKYDQLGREIQIEHEKWSQKAYGINEAFENDPLSQQYSDNGFDRAGNLCHFSIRDAITENQPNGLVKCDYKYDDLYQVIREEGIISHDFQYDSINNRISKDSQIYSINKLNQLLQDGKNTYAYDLNGNLIIKTDEFNKFEYKYDALDRLIMVEDEESFYHYHYDPLNRRVKKIKQSKSERDKNVLTHYIYQGQNEIGSIKIESDVDFEVNQRKAISELRVLGLGKGAEIGAAIAIEIDGKIYAPLHDLSGNVSCLIDAENGSVAETMRYSAFGEEFIYNANKKPIEKTEIGNPWHYASKRLDPETGFIYFGRRYYFPSTGRWITADPLGFDAGPNLYAYVLNNPLSHVDLYGLFGIGISNTNRWNSINGGRLGTGYRRISSSGFGGSLGYANGFMRSNGRDIGFGNLRGLGYGNGEFGLVSALKLPGRALNFIGWQLPFPLVKDVVMSVGNVMSGEKPFDNINCRAQHSNIYSVGGDYKLTADKVHIIFVNGVLNDKQDAETGAKVVSKAFNGHKVTLMHNATHGLGEDIFESIAIKLGFKTNSVRKLEEAIHNAFNSLPEDGTVILLGHSQGGDVIHGALKAFGESELGRMEAYTFGSARMISNPYLRNVNNFISSNDCVPYICDIFGIIRGCNDGTVTILKSYENPFIDHAFKNWTYNRELKKIALPFIN